MDNNIAGKISKEIEQYTAQLFYDKNPTNNLPSKPHASSVLITVNRKYFLITAGHTFEDVDISHIGIMIDHDFCTIGGGLSKIEPNNDNYEPNKRDLSIFQLDDVTIKTFDEKYKFLGLEQIEFNHYSVESSQYLVVGYPEEMTRKNFPTRSISPSALVMSTIGIAPEFYNLENINLDNVLILFLGEFVSSITKKLKKVPDMGGLSGGGVWIVFGNNNNYQYKLVSIVTGENSFKSHLYSTKIGSLLPWLVYEGLPK